MKKHTETSFVSMLGMPLRDLMRGAASLAAATENAIEPALAALPSGARDALGRALRAVEAGGGRFLAPQIGHDDIRRAAEFLRGTANRRRDAECCARVLAFAWEHIRASDAQSHDILSETLTTSRLAALRGTVAPDAGDHAAHLFADLRSWHVAGSMPGLPIAETPAQREATDLKLFALMVWLLTQRAADFEAEMRLLGLTMALTQALRRDILAAIGEPTGLAQQFKTIADHL